MAVAVWSPRQRYYGKSGPLQGTASWHESYGPREQAETHATPYFVPLSICGGGWYQKGRRPVRAAEGHARRFGIIEWDAWMERQLS